MMIIFSLPSWMSGLIINCVWCRPGVGPTTMPNMTWHAITVTDWLSGWCAVGLSVKDFTSKPIFSLVEIDHVRLTYYQCVVSLCFCRFDSEIGSEDICSQLPEDQTHRHTHSHAGTRTRTNTHTDTYTPISQVCFISFIRPLTVCTTFMHVN